MNRRSRTLHEMGVMREYDRAGARIKRIRIGEPMMPKRAARAHRRVLAGLPVPNEHEHAFHVGRNGSFGGTRRAQACSDRRCGFRGIKGENMNDGGTSDRPR